MSALAMPIVRPGEVGAMDQLAMHTATKLHAHGRFYGTPGNEFRPALAHAMKRGAMLLDGYRTGAFLSTPHPSTGLVLVSAELLAALQAGRVALADLLAAMEAHP